MALIAVTPKLFALILLLLTLWNGLVCAAVFKAVFVMWFGKSDPDMRRWHEIEQQSKGRDEYLQRLADEARQGETLAEHEFARELNATLRKSRLVSVKYKLFGLLFCVSAPLGALAAFFGGKHYLHGDALPVSIWVVWVLAVLPTALAIALVSYVAFYVSRRSAVTKV